MSLEDDLRAYRRDSRRPTDAEDAMQRALRGVADQILADAKNMRPRRYAGQTVARPQPAPSYLDPETGEAGGTTVHVITTLEA